MKNVCRTPKVTVTEKEWRDRVGLKMIVVFISTVGFCMLSFAVISFASLSKSSDPMKLEGLILAHRGTDEARTYPENTLAAIRHVHAQGADGIEIDVQLTKDGQMVLMHDLTLEKMTGDTRRIDEVTLNELQLLPLKHTGEGTHTIPTLEEALDVCHELGLVVNIELKQVQNPKVLAQKLTNLFEEKNLYGRAFVSSFLRDHLYALRKASSKITSVWITEEQSVYLNPKNILYRATALSITPKLLGIDGIFFHTSMLKGRLKRADEAKRAGYQVGVWTLNSAEDMKKLSSVSKLIITDRVETFTA